MKINNAKLDLYCLLIISIYLLLCCLVLFLSGCYFLIIPLWGITIPMISVALIIMQIAVVLWLLLQIVCYKVKYSNIRQVIMHFVILIAIVFLPSMMQFNHKIFLLGVRRCVKHQVDVIAIQKWIDEISIEGARKIIDENSKLSRQISTLPCGSTEWIEAVELHKDYLVTDSSVWPKAINDIPNSMIHIEMFGSKVYVNIVQGGALTGHFGFVVGVNAEEFQGNHTIEVGDNVFIWSNLKTFHPMSFVGRN